MFSAEVVVGAQREAGEHSRAQGEGAQHRGALNYKWHLKHKCIQKQDVKKIDALAPLTEKESQQCLTRRLCNQRNVFFYFSTGNPALAHTENPPSTFTKALYPAFSS